MLVRVVRISKSTIMRTALLVFLTTLIFSCKKENETAALRTQIAGTWELERAIGFAVNQSFPPGNGRIIIIGNDGSFERRQNDTLVFRGVYTLQEKKDCHPRDTDFAIWTNESNTDDYRYIDLKEDKLTFSTPNCYQDGGDMIYRRVK